MALVQLRRRRAERSALRRHKSRAPCATAPNQLFSWDIAFMSTRVTGLYLYLNLFKDVFSRKIVSWQIYEVESIELASEFMRDICIREAIAPNQMVLHSDNGSPMKGTTLQALGAAPLFNRPVVSNGNPYSESLFKTLIYWPAHLRQVFESPLAARQRDGTFVQWYNHKQTAIVVCNLDVNSWRL